MDILLCLLIYLIAFFARFSKALARIGLGRYEEYEPGKPLKLLLAGYNGARNTGSDARVAAITEQLLELYGRDRILITVMTLDETTMEGYFDPAVRMLPFSSFFPFDLYRACCRHHAVLICEGSTLKSTFANALSLFFCEAAGIMASQGKPCLAYGSEIGRMDPFVAKASSRLCRSTYFITRTEESIALLGQLGLKGHTGTDTAWIYDKAISADRARELLLEAGWDGRKPLLGVAVIDPFCWPVQASLGRWLKGLITGNQEDQYDKWYYFSNSPERRAAFSRYTASIAGAVERFCREQNFQPVLIGMERMDKKACMEVQKHLGTPVPVFLSQDCSAPVMTGILRSLSLLITSRYHAAVLSMEEPCPIVAVSFDERLDSLMREFSFNKEYLHHASDPDLKEDVYSSLLLALKEQASITAHIRAQLPIEKKKLAEMGTFLKNYFPEAF